MKHTSLKLSYGYRDLEPFLDERTIFLHYEMHYRTYVNNTNQLLREIDKNLKKYDLFNLIQNLNMISNQDLKILLRNNAGGVINHEIFFKGLKIGTNLSQKMQYVIESKFENIKKFKEKFEKNAISCFGSGWTWLVLKNEDLSIMNTPNQENPSMYNDSSTSYYPIFGIDLWEHSYYLKYQNRKKEYIQSFWNVLNWEEAENRLLIGKSKLR
ncbi:Fe-Mn family superoxide dismutase [Candidatus Riesia pediculicola]|uniref:Fe-Mn family superoxide dismutase n=1 Tax=Candidatus Riesia pediculicola TaxID=401619 RepID=UPI0009C2E013|nr:Fe-Mn family superoxide dismutase [Candidatus Riesia pediculicola]ARC54405.1 superoxide dismutase [Candidatus Riesia pediculicola]